MSPSPSSHDEGSEPGPQGGITSSAFVACSTCRKAKAKCKRSIPGAEKCDRCRATVTDCVVEPHKRGRPRTRDLSVSVRRDPTRRASAPLAPVHAPASLDHELERGSVEHSFGDPHTAALDGRHESVFARPTQPCAPDLPIREPLPGPSPLSGSVDDRHEHDPLALLNGANDSLSLRHLLDAGGLEPEQDAADSRRASIGAGDVVSKAIISDEIAQTLFVFFFSSLNPVILLLDPRLHTYEYIRSRSTFLFTAILAAAADFAAPIFSQVLSRELADLSLHAAFDGQRSIETVQAWMTVYFWKDPKDTRAWTYVGLLCRLAVEIGLDRTPIECPGGMTETQQRDRRNRHRTWMLAFMMDRALASVSGRDWCLRGRDPIISACREFSNHPLREHGDAVIAAFAELRRFQSVALEQLGERSPIVHADRQRDVSRVLLNVNFDLDDWHHFWASETARWSSPPIYMELLQFFELHIRLNLNSYAVNLVDQPSAAGRVAPLNSGMMEAEQRCLGLSMRSLYQLRRLFDIDERVLHYAQDSMSIMIAYAACYLRRLVNSPTFSENERDHARQLINDTSLMFRRPDTGVGNAQKTARMQARFLQSLAAQRSGSGHLEHGDARPESGLQSTLGPLTSTDTFADPGGPGMEELLAWFADETGRVDAGPSAPASHVGAGAGGLLDLGPSAGDDAQAGQWRGPFTSAVEDHQQFDGVVPELSNLADSQWEQLLSTWLAS